MATVELPAQSFGAVIALYSLFHIPLDEQRTLIGSVRRWLRPGGLFLATVSNNPWTGVEEDWLGAGATMWWAEERADTHLDWLLGAGFEVRWRRFVPEGDGGHELILAVAGRSAKT